MSAIAKSQGCATSRASAKAPRRPRRLPARNDCSRRACSTSSDRPCRSSASRSLATTIAISRRSSRVVACEVEQAVHQPPGPAAPAADHRQHQRRAAGGLQHLRPGDPPGEDDALDACAERRGHRQRVGRAGGDADHHAVADAQLHQGLADIRTPAPQGRQALQIGAPVAGTVEGDDVGALLLAGAGLQPAADEAVEIDHRQARRQPNSATPSRRPSCSRRIRSVSGRISGTCSRRRRRSEEMKRRSGRGAALCRWPARGSSPWICSICSALELYPQRGLQQPIGASCQSVAPTSALARRAGSPQAGESALDQKERQVIDELFGKLQQLDRQSPAARRRGRGAYPPAGRDPARLALLHGAGDPGAGAGAGHTAEPGAGARARGGGAPGRGRRLPGRPVRRPQPAARRPRGRTTRGRSPSNICSRARAARPARPGARPAGGGFLAGAMQTALGVAGGMMIANAITSAFDSGTAEAAEPAQEEPPADEPAEERGGGRRRRSTISAATPAASTSRSDRGPRRDGQTACRALAYNSRRRDSCARGIRGAMDEAGKLLIGKGDAAAISASCRSPTGTAWSRAPPAPARRSRCRCWPRA